MFASELIDINYTNTVAYGGEVPLARAGEHLTAFKDLEEWLGREGEMGIKNAIAEIGYVGRAYGITYNDKPRKLVNEAVYAVDKIEESRTEEKFSLEKSKDQQKQAEELKAIKQEEEKKPESSILADLAKGGEDPFKIPTGKAVNDEAFDLLKNEKEPVMRMTGVDSIEKIGEIKQVMGEVEIKNVVRSAIDLVPNATPAANDGLFKVASGLEL